MGCDFHSDGVCKSKGELYMEGITSIGAMEPDDSKLPNCCIAFFVDGSNLKAKYKDAGGTITVFTIDTNPPGFQPPAP